ncbi:MAG: hypothetical protein CMF62_02250 [Magnetococcales bacterium]|nr:hypothetical protein [Magnetococcales bacterium]
MLENGRDKYGVFPLRGKLLNVREANPKQLLNNEEIRNIKQILGLKQDKKYEKKEDLKDLRYGGIIVLTDQDLDGFHIKGLIINFIHFFWPSLLKIPGFITTMKTPIVKVFKKSDDSMKKGINFYTLTDYKKWEDEANANNTIKQYAKPKYYKGLGTSTPEEAESIFNDFEKHIIEFIWSGTEKEKMLIEDNDSDLDDMSSDEESEKDDSSDDKSSDSKYISDKKSVDYGAINLAFSKSFTGKRKEWLRLYDRNKIIETKDTTVSYHDFVHKELIHFSNYDNIRSIPSVCDGFKPSQRKIFYGSVLKNILKNEVKVAQLSGFVSDKAKYHHGEVSLQGAIVKMAQNFIGSNNLNVLTPNGQFGSRIKGGDDASAARYIFTRLNELSPLIFRKEDNPVLNYVNDEGDTVEPETYAPIIPMILVNGTQGIGTGFSTTVPCYNPKEIIKNILGMIDGKEAKNMKPWYRWFKGTITKSGDTTYETKGIYQELGGDVIRITELPIGVWTEQYKEFLKSVRIEDPKKPVKSKYIDDFVDNSNDNDIDITITFAQGRLREFIKNNELEKKLKLTKSVNISNMHLYNKDGFIQKYQNIQEVMKEYYDFRMNIYDKRKAYRIKQLENELKIISNKVRFIKIRIEKKPEEKKIVRMNNVATEEVITQLETAKFDKMHSNFNAPLEDRTFEYLLSMQMRSLTKEKVKDLENEKEKKTEELNDYRKTPSNDFWRRELNELMEAYESWINKLEKSRTSNIKKKKISKKGKKKITK